MFFHTRTNVTIIGDLYSGRECTTALGYNSSVLNIGTASYPAVGSAYFAGATLAGAMFFVAFALVG